MLGKFFSCRKHNVRAMNFYIHPNLNRPRFFLEYIFNIYDDSNWLSQSLFPSLSRHWLISFRKIPFPASSVMLFSLCPHVKSPSVVFSCILQALSLFWSNFLIVRKELKVFLRFPRQEFIRCDLKDLAKCLELISRGIRLFCFPIADHTPSCACSVGELRERHVSFAKQRIFPLTDCHCLLLYRCPIFRIHYKP